MPTDPLNPFGSDPLLNPFDREKTSLIGANQGGGITGGGVNISRAGERAREGARQKAEQKAWEEDRSAALEKANQEPQPPSTKPRLANPRFEASKLKVHEEVIVTCDCTDGARRDGVQFDIFALDSNQKWVRITGVAGCGQKVTLFPASATMADKPGKYKIIASHFNAKDCESGPFDADASDDFKGLILYSFQRREYLVLENDEEAGPWLKAAQDTEALSAALHKAYRDPKPEQRLNTFRSISEDAEKLFDGKPQSKGNHLEELLQVAGNWRDGKRRSFVYVAPYLREGKPVSGAWRKESDATVKKKLDKALKRDKAAGKPDPWWKTKIKLKLLPSAYTDGQWPIPWAKHADKDANGETINWSPEAAMCRFVAGFAGADFEVDPTKGKVKIGASGELAYSFFEGKVGGKWQVPDDNGIDLVRLMKKNKYVETFIKAGHECRLRLEFEFSAKTFTGVSVNGALNVLSLDLTGLKGRGDDASKSSNKLVHASAGVKVSAFAGSEAGVEAKVKGQWSPAHNCFADLCDVGYEFTGIVGGAAGVEYQISFENGRFYLAASAMVAAKFGMRKGFKVGLDAKEGIKFIGHLLNSVDCHHVVEITADAYRAFKNISFVWLNKGLKGIDAISEATIREVDEFNKWLADIAAKNFPSVKAHLTGSAGHGYNRYLAPEALGQTLVTIMQTWSATDAKAIMWFLNAAETPHKLRWVIRFVSRIDIPPETHPMHKPRKKEAYEIGKQKLLDFADGIAPHGARKDMTLRIELETIFLRAGNHEDD